MLLTDNTERLQVLLKMKTNTKKFLSAVLAIIVLVTSFSFMASASFKKNNDLSAWKAVVQSNYDEFIAEVDGDSDKIPFIVSTDQHGFVKANSEIFTYIDDVVDWNKISKIINLGDTVTLFFNPYELLSYKKATQCLPAEKRIEIFGNHDGYIFPVRLLMDFFYPATVKTAVSGDKRAFVVKDEQFNIRYLQLDTMRFPWSYSTGRLSTQQADFIVNELSKDDSSDIVFLAHNYIFNDAMVKRDGTTFTGSDYFIGGEKKYANVKQSFVDMLEARKNKTAGVLIDCKGVEHPYDFTDCKGDFLMTLHGHHHTEGYETKNGITEFLFQSLRHDGDKDTEPNCFYFAYIDRSTKTFKCWKNIEGYDAWEISIA